MGHKRAALRRIGLMAAILIGTALACNMPTTEKSTQETPAVTPAVDQPGAPTSTPAQATLASPQTVPASISTSDAQNENSGSEPTFTPIRQPTLAATLTPSATPSRRPTSTPRPGVTSTPVKTGGPLDFSYNIQWRFKDAAALVSIATVTINATGGSGVYAYFRDDLQVDGPVFEYEWASCHANPGSLRVDSSDGQSKRVDYFQNPPCPTPTPTP
jgi:hypothetical protein